MGRREPAGPWRGGQEGTRLLTGLFAPPDATQAAKRLRVGLAYGNVADLPAFSTGPRGDAAAIHRAIAAAGYEALQGGDPALCRDHGLAYIAIGVIPTVADAEPFATQAKTAGALGATCIAGYGYESDAEMDALAGEILRVSRDYGLPIYIETHRASITQDAWRTVQLARRLPEVRFNGDFSHWFTGQEMPYGDFAARLTFLAPVFVRTRFLHGRIGDRCSMQVDIGDGTRHPSIPAFRAFWTEAMRGFLAAPDAGPDLWFCPELLGTEYLYARAFPAADGTLREESDRWTQARVLATLARECFAEARTSA